MTPDENTKRRDNSDRRYLTPGGGDFTSMQQSVLSARVTYIAI